VTANDARRLADLNIETTATVLGNRFVAPSVDDNGDGSHFITYSFDWDGAVITKERNVPKDIFETHPVGHNWPIRVHPDEPRIHDLYDGETRANAWGNLVVSLLTGVLGVFLGLSNGNLTALRSRLR
jgi:hypothetical protein